MHAGIRRREFLKNSVAAGAAISLAGRAFGAQEAAPALKRRGSANEKLNIAIIGTGHRGRDNTDGVQSENIVALCDVDTRFLGESGKRFPKATHYRDWRVLFDKQKDIDAVVCSTADHHHAFIAVAAMELGYHVYCEKPLGASVAEARKVRETYLKNKDKVATQQGTQIHATENYRRVVELVRSGCLGQVKEAHVWCDRVGPGGEYPQAEEPPACLDWELWVGPSPFHPYSSKLVPKQGSWNCLSWNWVWDFGNGTVSDMGSHLIDLAYWALDLDFPTTCEAKADPWPASPVSCSKWLIATWDHPAKGDRGPVKVMWYDAEKRPPSPPGIDLKQWGIGAMFVGSKGTLVADYGKHYLLPRPDYRHFEPPNRESWIAPSPGHHAEWIKACKTGSPTLCNFDYAGKLIEHNLLSNVAYRTGKKLEWDAANLKATNCPEADQFIKREYRKGWTI
jgi:predicted dehydrogenase